MTVSYQIIGGGNPTPPSFSYQQNGANKILTLMTTAQSVLVDVGSTWSVSPNPLSGSIPNQEEWRTFAPTSGTVSGPTTRTFTYQHRLWLTMAANPSNGGTVFPSSGWHNAGTFVMISAIPKSGFVFSGWAGTGAGSFTGAGTTHTIAMNSPISETGNFVVPPLTVTLLSPSNGATLSSSLVHFTVRVTFINSPVSGASVLVFVDNNLVCTGLTNVSGLATCSATITKTYSNTRTWFATASKAGFQDGTSQTFNFKF